MILQRQHFRQMHAFLLLVVGVISGAVPGQDSGAKPRYVMQMGLGRSGSTAVMEVLEKVRLFVVVFCRNRAKRQQVHLRS